MLPRKAAFFTSICAESISSGSGPLEYAMTAEDMWILVKRLYSSEPNDGCHLGGSNAWATIQASPLYALSARRPSKNTLEAPELLMSLLLEVEMKDAVNKNASSPSKHKWKSESDTVSALRTEDCARHSYQSTAPTTTFASKLRESLTTITAGSSLLVVEAKWAEDPAVSPSLVPFADWDHLSVTHDLPSVWKLVSHEAAEKAQHRCIERVMKLRKAIPASSVETEQLDRGTTN